MGHVPPPPPPDRTADALKAAVRKIRRRWWEFVNWKRVGCWLRLGHQRPLLLDYHTLECKRCGHVWLDDGGLI